MEQKLKKMLGKRCKVNYPLAEFTTFGTGGPAKFLAFPDNLEEVRQILLAAQEGNLPLLILGQGSNLIVSDLGFPGIVLATHRLSRVSRSGSRVTAQAGVRLHSLMKLALQEGLSGLEFLAGIPGTVGGAVIMNAGLKKEWLSERIETAEVITLEGKTRELSRNRIDFGYRKSGLEGFLVWQVRMKLVPDDRKVIRDRIASYLKKRKQTQPVASRSAGSVFKNPPGKFAGELIENCGLKGYKIGGAKVSEKHANFIINTGSASSADFRNLMEFVQKEVERKHSIKLEPEVKIVGEFHEDCSACRRG